MTPRELQAHIGAIASRPAYVAVALTQRCWPDAAETDGGAARAWLSRWAPRGAGVLPPVCGCAVGRCTICN